jgi:N-acetylglucosaminyldiphosphoundecaprenol N-acetyl-beta-D-mannosaminyltransferase
MKQKELPVIGFTGVGLNAITFEQLYKRVDNWLKDKAGRSHHIACVNAYCISLSLGNSKLRNIYNSADVVGADGKPFVSWINRISKHNCDRLTAPNTLVKLIEKSKETGYTFYLYGGAPEVVKQMKANLEKRFSYVKIVGYYSPPFRELSTAEKEDIIANINALQPDIISVGLGTPKQDYWIDEHIHKIKGSVMLASGATFDFFGGRIKMAPKFIQESGFEWLYRLFSKDFKRLWKRYTWYNIKFMTYFLLQKLNIYKIPVRRNKRD